jgi:hypothetical protein
MYQFSEIARFRKSNVLSEFNYLLDQITQNKCNNSDNHKIAILIRKLIENPEFARGKDQLNDYLSALALYAGDIGTAISYAKESLKYSSKPDRNIYMIKLLLIGGRNIEAKKEIIKFRNFISMKPRLLVAYSKVLDDLEVQIKQSGNTSD